MSGVDELQKKYPWHAVEYEPQKDCRRCHGTGEYQNRTGYHLCVCTCVDFDGIGGIFSDWVKKETLPGGIFEGMDKR